MSKTTSEETAMQKETMLRELEENYGNITRAAKAANIAASTHFRWMKEDEQYEKRADASKDVGYRKLKDNIIDMAMDKAQKGNVAVLNKLLGILLKEFPTEMKTLNRANNVPLTARIHYVDTREEAEEIMRSRGQMR